MKLGTALVLAAPAVLAEPLCDVLYDFTLEAPAAAGLSYAPAPEDIWTWARHEDAGTSGGRLHAYRHVKFDLGQCAAAPVALPEFDYLLVEAYFPSNFFIRTHRDCWQKQAGSDFRVDLLQKEDATRTVSGTIVSAPTYTVPLGSLDQAKMYGLSIGELTDTFTVYRIQGCRRAAHPVVHHAREAVTTTLTAKFDRHNLYMATSTSQGTYTSLVYDDTQTIYYSTFTQSSSTTHTLVTETRFKRQTVIDPQQTSVEPYPLVAYETVPGTTTATVTTTSTNYGTTTFTTSNDETVYVGPTVSVTSTWLDVTKFVNAAGQTRTVYYYLGPGGATTSVSTIDPSETDPEEPTTTDPEETDPEETDPEETGPTSTGDEGSTTASTDDPEDSDDTDDDEPDKQGGAPARSALGSLVAAALLFL